MADEFGGDIAAQALYLLGLIERHGWTVKPSNEEPGCAWLVQCDDDFRGHFAPTLIEALTAASRCSRCTGKTGE